jgi:His/Glu/Gln/Arg/opine family amino acid ABC transporter permease subunit
MSIDLSFLTRVAPTLAQGLATTVLLAVPAMLLSALWGIAIVAALLSRTRFVAGSARGYVEIVRDTPILVQMFVIFFGSGYAGYPLSGFTAGLLALVLQNGAYAAEIYRGGINGVPHRLAEAGLALGLTPRRSFRLIVLPIAIRNVLPPLSNQGVLIIKDTSLVATISVAELTFQARLLADRTAAVFEIFFTLALFYLVLTAIFSGSMRLLERRVRIT